MKKIKYRNVRQYFSYRRIQQKAGESGAACTPQGYAGIFGAVMVITVLTGWFYRLQPIWIFMVMAAGILCIPEKEISRCGCIYSSDDLFI